MPTKDCPPAWRNDFPQQRRRIQGAIADMYVREELDARRHAEVLATQQRLQQVESLRSKPPSELPVVASVQVESNLLPRLLRLGLISGGVAGVGFLAWKIFFGAGVVESRQLQLRGKER